MGKKRKNIVILITQAVLAVSLLLQLINHWNEKNTLFYSYLVLFIVSVCLVAYNLRSLSFKREE
jgi:Ca2+/Na+ antiporter